MKYAFILFVSLVLGTTACTNTKHLETGTTVLEVLHGTSFGHCRGYCTMNFIYTPSEANFVRRSVDSASFPPQTTPLNFTKDEWTKIVQAIDWDAFSQLPERIGCPDCADGGAEYIEIKTTIGSNRVTIELGANIPELEKLLPLLRKIRTDKLPSEN